MTQVDLMSGTVKRWCRTLDGLMKALSGPGAEAGSPALRRETERTNSTKALHLIGSFSCDTNSRHTAFMQGESTPHVRGVIGKDRKVAHDGIADRPRA
jgi:hypothetical protein